MESGRKSFRCPFLEDQELFCVTTATAHYAKGIAWAASGNVVAAERECDLFETSLRRVPAARMDFPNKCVDTLAVGAAMLDGEIKYRKGEYTEAFSSLRKAIELDNGLVYSEPWGWMQPVSHAYAALLLEQGFVEEAANVYRADLGLHHTSRARKHPNNVWSLQGYHECLVRMGRVEEAQIIEPQLRLALAIADIPVKSSCFCRTEAPLADKDICCSKSTTG